MSARERPLSPHLQVYKLEYTMLLSILHRATGCALVLALLGFVAWLWALSAGPVAYACMTTVLGSVVGKLVLAAAVTGFWYHFTTGIRHLCWDAGYGLDKAQARRSAKIALVVIALLSAASLAVMFCCGGRS
ncbi:MAG: succinate dehydrogenase, cytochrome b556 subunit [Pseudomonadota bacterium]|jgi:succinate dehydrogenase / fumarate reductase, cytochrome b subunit